MYFIIITTIKDGHLKTELIYQWSDHPPGVEISSKIFLPTFSLVGYNQHQGDEHFSTGIYSQVTCDIFLIRSIGFYISQVYIPAILIVIISWLPFWLDQEDHHARVALGVTTVLTMTTLVTSRSSDFPKISYLKAIDIYLFTSFIMVFLSLIEYAIVGYYEFKFLKKLEKKDNENKENKLQSFSSATTNENNDYKQKKQTSSNKKCTRSGMRLNDFSYDADNENSTNIKLCLITAATKTADHDTTTTINNQNAKEGQTTLKVASSLITATSIDQKRSSQQKNQPQQQQKQRTSKAMIEDTSVIDQWARWLFPCTFIVFNIIYIFGLFWLVSINSSHQLIQVKL